MYVPASQEDKDRTELNRLADEVERLRKQVEAIAPAVDACPICGSTLGRRGMAGKRNCLQHNGHCGELILPKKSPCANERGFLHRTRVLDGVVQRLKVHYETSVHLYFKQGKEVTEDEYYRGVKWVYG